MNKRILPVAELRHLESLHADAVPPLMQRAGVAAASVAREMLAASPGIPLVVAGPGNNGGDAFVVANELRAAGFMPQLLFGGTADRLPADARRAHDEWIAGGGLCSDSFPEGNYGLIIDGLFGIGLARPIEGRLAEWIARINAGGAPVLALDIPSGLDANTGAVRGPCVRASRTATFLALKPGLLTADGPDHCGTLELCTLGIDAGAAGGGTLISRELFASALRPRLRNSHKGSFGSVAIVGGAPGMAGAALLAGRAALGLGAGRVYVGLLETLPVAPMQPELMLRAADTVFESATVVAIGPGLGQSAQAGKLLRRAIESALPLVIDADGLNLLAQAGVQQRKLAARPAPTADAVPPAPILLTPHPAEAARLLGSTAAAIQADRRAAALELARRFNAHVALKGCGTIVAAPDGRWFINGSGNPGLASAGTGDVLTGMLAALLAQGWPPLEALLAAVHLHGAAADACVAAGAGPVGLAAGELIPAARRLLNHWIDG